MIRAKYQIPALFFILAAAIVATVLFTYRASPGSLGSTTWELRTDTYYIVSHTFIFWVLGAYFLACALLYLIFGKVSRKAMSLRLGHVHFWLSTAAVAILLYSFYKTEPFLGTNLAGAEAATRFLRKLGFVAFFGFFVAQIVFFVNIVSTAAATRSISNRAGR